MDFGNRVANLFGQEVEMYKVSSGHFCIDLLKEGKSFCFNKEEDRDKEINHVLINQDSDLSLKQLQKLHHVFGQTKVDRLKKLIKAADK